MSETKNEGLVSFAVPRDPSNDDPNLYICINGKAWLLPKGQVVKVPQFVLDEYNRSVEAKEKFFRLNEKLEQQSKVVQGV